MMRLSERTILALNQIKSQNETYDECIFRNLKPQLDPNKRLSTSTAVTDTDTDRILIESTKHLDFAGFIEVFSTVSEGVERLSNIHRRQALHITRLEEEIMSLRQQTSPMASLQPDQRGGE
jgi:hypothetical protein